MGRHLVSRDDGAGIAIVGMACRLPGADSPTALWRNVRTGVESITFFDDAELVAAGIEPALLRRPEYVKAAPLIAHADVFDAAFFGYSPREASVMEPGQRIFLEVAWEAFEDAGYNPARIPGVVGVFAGGGSLVTSYFAAHPGHPALIGQTASLEHLGNDKDFLATRVSYKLDLTGPSVTVQTACSTSLVAVHLACQSLLTGESDVVLAGASTVRIPQVSGYLAPKGQVNSPDGHCRAFDAAASGTIFGSGVIAVVLKRLHDARADGDHVWAVIRGTALSNDGGRKMSYTAPSVIGQARAMVDALTVAGVQAETIRYVECHATGTPVGDPLEIQALTRAWGRAGRPGSCAVGSVKTNIGHPEQAAGLAGLVKAVLAIHHAAIPPSLHCETPNPAIDFPSTPFYVNTRLVPWPEGDHPRRAAVNSLGIGGTNAFVVLEQAPADEPGPSTSGPAVFTMSARTESALSSAVARVREFLTEAPNITLADVCYTSNVSRSQHGYRLAVMASSIGELAERLAGVGPADRRSVREGGARVAFLFTGQGAHYPGMAVELYRTQPVFREAIERCDARLRAYVGRRIVDVLTASGELADALDRTEVIQPVTFAVQYALARLWESWGVIPAAVLGHSLGELAAACIAGAMDVDDALAFVAERGRLMAGLPGQGAMAAIFAEEATVRETLSAVGGRLTIAALNAPTSLVISGPLDEVTEAIRRFEARGIAMRPLTLGHGFHSSLVDPILDALEAAAGRVPFAPPRVPIVSNVTGMRVEAAPSARYWRDHARHPVRFAEGIQTLAMLGCDAFLEIGGGGVLVALGRQTLTDPALTWTPSLGRGKSDAQSLTEALRSLYLAGADIDWEQVHAPARPRRISLPTYPFERHRFWVDGSPRAVTIAAATAPPTVGADTPRHDAADRPRPLLLGASLPVAELRAVAANDVGAAAPRNGARDRDWFYGVRWVEAPHLTGRATPGTWLVLADAGGVAEKLARNLEADGHDCHLVRPGPAFARLGDRRWSADPVRLEHFESLFRALAESSRTPLRGVVHLWAMDATVAEDTSLESLAGSETVAAGSALAMARALSARDGAAPWWVVTRNGVSAGHDSRPTEPVAAMLWGLARTIALESPRMRGALIDLPATGHTVDQDADVLVREITCASAENQIAYRNGHRLAARLARLDLIAVPDAPVVVREDASYVITGGLGMIGLHVARWLVEERGARTLVLVSRGRPNDAASAVVASLQSRAARVDVLNADVATESGVHRLAEHLRKLPRLAGIVHGAGVLDDGILEQMTWERFTRVTAPKVRGGWLLHQLTREMPLDFFVVQSSLMGLLGSAGQSNYSAANAFLDGLATRRRALGLPATAIAWGPWAEGGMATAAGSRGQAHWRALGVGYLTPVDGVRALGDIMTHPVDRVAVAIADWDAYVAQFPETPAFYADVGRARALTPPPPANGSLRERLRQAPAPERRTALIQLCRTHAMEELGFTEPIDTQRPLDELGLDSLMSVNLANRLESALGVRIPIVRLIQGPSVEQFVDTVLVELVIAGARAASDTATSATGPPVVRASEVSGDRWIVRPRPNPAARVRLVCFPYAGGNAATYRPWVDALDRAFELIAIDPPGRAARVHEAPIDRLERFVDALGPHLEPYLDRPAAFFGHCLGGLTLFETARRLRTRRTLDLAHIFVSGARPPGRLGRKGQFEEQLLTRLLRKPGFDPFRRLHEQNDDIFGDMIRHFNIGATEEFLASDELRRLLFPAIRAEFAMAARYRYEPEPAWPVPVTCFAGLTDPYVSRDDALAWGQHTSASFRLHLREGAHFLVVDDRHFIVRAINQELSA
jgi:acyl transferase domain-containing protein/surfactin synthase thioesterase subunit/acyl carrier protein